MVHSYFILSTDLATKLENSFNWLVKHYCTLTGAICTKKTNILHLIQFSSFTLFKLFTWNRAVLLMQNRFSRIWEKKLNKQNGSVSGLSGHFELKMSNKKKNRIFGWKLILSAYRIILEGFWRKRSVGRKNAFCSSVTFHQKHSKTIRNAPKPLIVQKYEFFFVGCPPIRRNHLFCTYFFSLFRA